MPEYRRVYRPGGTYFFTIVTHARRRLFADSANVDRLRDALRATREQWPFKALAGVVLPDHMHFVWALPAGDADYSKRIGRMKALFTKSLTGTRWDALSRGDSANESRRQHGEREVWQRRFWEHTIRDVTDLEHHVDYLHYNPVKHGLCACPHAWPASSFSRWVVRKVYDSNWCCSCTGSKVKAPYPATLDDTVGE